VVPGYVKCPKCHSELPAGSGRAKRATAEPGGTALETRDFPIAPFVAALAVAAAIIIVFSVRSAGKKTGAAAPTLPAPIEAVAAPPAPVRPTTAAASLSPVAQGSAAALQDPRAAAAELETALRFQRLWGRVELAGPRIDLRSGSCSDPAMRPLIESKQAVLRGAGLTRLRCVEQSGAVVFEHDL
jgi:hypothetical protein